MATVDTVGIPRLACLYRTQEHFVETQGISTILLDNHIWIYHVEHTLRHLLDGPSADVLAILQDELSVLILRAPSLECLDIQYIVAYDVYIYVDRSYVVILLQVQTYEYRSLVVVIAVDAVNEVRATLDHTLVHQLLEWLFLAAYAEVEEELVPETGVNQVTGSMLATTYVEVHVLPVLISLLAYESLIVVRIHIAQVVSRRTCETWHGVELQWEYGLVIYEALVNHLFLLCIPSPLLGSAQWWLASLCWLVGLNLRQFEWQALLWNHLWHSVLVIYREWLTPVALTGEDGVAETIVYLYSADALLGNKLLGSCDSLLHGESVQREAIHAALACYR